MDTETRCPKCNDLIDADGAQCFKCNYDPPTPDIPTEKTRVVAFIILMVILSFSASKLIEPFSSVTWSLGFTVGILIPPSFVAAFSKQRIQAFLVIWCLLVVIIFVGRYWIK